MPLILRARFDSEATYILAGGLGGLGRSIISWMMDRGARHFAILSRKGRADSEAVAFVNGLKSRSACVHMHSCDISVRDDVLNTVEEITRFRVVKGIIHAAMTLQVSYITLNG